MTEIGHKLGGTEFTDRAGAEEYARTRHGLDGGLLLDPYFIPYITHFSTGADVVDIGCGAAPWSITAAKAGANRVFGFDLSPQMIGQAVVATNQHDRLLLGRADALQVPVQTESVDVALSINVTCNLPGLDETNPKLYPTFKHFTEMARILKTGGIGIFTTPSSLDIPFTTYGHEQDASNLQADLAEVTSEEQMMKLVKSQEEVLRATIVGDGPHWRLLTPGDSLPLGARIWRKIPGLVVPNYFHTEAEYDRTIERAGLTVVEKSQPKLDPDKHLPETGLGLPYTRYNAFGIYILQKTAMNL